VPYRVRVSPRCRRLGLRFSDDGLEVVAPTRLRDVSHDFLFQRFSGWIRRQILKRERRVQRAASDHVLLRGVETPLAMIAIQTAGDPRRFFFEEARRDVLVRLAARSAEMGQPHGAVQIREQKTLWGSCSPRSGTLSFNAKLVMAPPAVLDYIVVHELAHFKWSRHSVRFWERVARFCPNYKIHRRWLRDNAWRLSIPSTPADPAPLLAPATL